MAKRNGKRGHQKQLNDDQKLDIFFVVGWETQRLEQEEGKEEKNNRWMLSIDVETCVFLPLRTST